MSNTKFSSQRWLPILRHAGTLAFASVLFLSSMYCLLAYIPTTYFSFIQAPFQAWMPIFARLQAYLFIISFCGVAFPLRRFMHSRITRAFVVEFWVMGALASVYLIWAQPVRFLRNNSLSFVWAIAFLLPLISLGAVYYATYLGRLTITAGTARSVSWLRVVLAALLISIIYPGATYLRFYIAGMPVSLTRFDWIGNFWAVVTQALLFVFVFGVVEMSRRLAARSKNPDRAEFALFTALFWAGLTIAMLKVVLASIPLEGIDATVYACVFSLSAVGLAGGWALRRHVHLLEPGSPAQVKPRRLPASYEVPVILVVIMASAVTVPSFIGIMDWHAILEKIWAMIFWVMVAALIIWRRQRERRGDRVWPFAVIAVLSLIVFRLGLYSEKGWGLVLGERGQDVPGILQLHAAVDASFAAASEIMTPSSAVPCNDQCRFIQHQTNIPSTAFVELHDLNLAENLQAHTGARPDIFVIVVDSLRRDYLSAYNPKVTFTPAIGAFAADSVTFRNAFTRYAGTTLSEPSIWSGLLQLHKHYVQPFHRVNNLEKLVQADGYQSLVSVDTVLHVLLQPDSNLIPLDATNKKWTDLDFCSTAAEVTNRMTGLQGGSQPVFLYTQPQNIHLVTLESTSRLRPPKRNYGQFVDYYASELERLDGCFGNFIHKLKALGVYENSIIVLTSDHGEDLQKVGTERHAFSLKPEVIRIPLIVHVPPQIKKTWYCDPDWIAFNTDIAATLYELTGHGPVIARREFGRPLFTPSSAEMEKYRQGSYMIASSYGFLYGLLYDNGKT
ncbi:MAG TPA: sulfatase-like hydrolase/transferase, partial [Candidatus Angelobacter sp.]|nr:sulfatase-like hydrolase/transferase [Candidatus Angelobacter sp.]